MDTYKPLYSNESLKKECEDCEKQFNSPLAIAREAVRRIHQTRSKKVKKISREDWQDLPENEPYMIIARDFNLRKIRELKERKARKKK